MHNNNVYNNIKERKHLSLFHHSNSFVVWVHFFSSKNVFTFTDVCMRYVCDGDGDWLLSCDMNMDMVLHKMAC